MSQNAQESQYFEGYNLTEISRQLSGQIYLYQSQYTLRYLRNLQNEESKMTENYALSQMTEFESIARQMILTDNVITDSPHSDFVPKCHMCNNPVQSWANKYFDRYNVRRLSIGVVYLCDHCFTRICHCHICNSEMVLNGDNRYRVDGDTVTICENCQNDDSLIICDHCQNFTTDDTCTRIANGDIICDSCISHYSACYDCDDWYHDNDITINANGNSICENCMENYSYCDSCGEYFDSDYMHYNDRTCECLCENCNHTSDYSDYLRGYHDNPEKRFHRTMEDRLNDNKVYFGFELETECDDIESACYDIYQLSDNENYLYLMEDGSLDHGFELISQPMTLDYHKTQMRWDNVLSQMRRYDCDCDRDTVGLHVHVSKRYISDKTQIKIAYFVHMFHDYFEKLARRESSYYTRYTDKRLNQNAQESQTTRYESVNFENSATIEFRIFQSTDRYDYLISSLELIDAVVKFCEVSSNDVFIQNDKTTALFERFVIASKCYDYLPKYIEQMTK